MQRASLFFGAAADAQPGRAAPALEGELSRSDGFAASWGHGEVQSTHFPTLSSSGPANLPALGHFPEPANLPAFGAAAAQVPQILPGKLCKPLQLTRAN